MKMNLSLTKKDDMNVMRNDSRRKAGLLSLDAVNQILIVVVAVLLGHAAVKYFSPEPMMSDLVLEDTVIKREISVSDIAVKKVKSFQIYEESIRARNLFDSLKNDLKPDAKILEKALPALHKRIRLIGILIDSDSKAIVEDLKEKQTHFLSKGESIGSVLLEDIQEDKVIFQYENERVEMAL